ncbi:BA75_04027T0 [Komagataella pastoris]|uniref:BA75_04027T0 n=1 Tax=Komagataella pastoris TaxID=4922 RepID=A0A1B2JF43_PICPA|nr:BA75_04027T0 [Komagataella pastoris]
MDQDIPDHTVASPTPTPDDEQPIVVDFFWNLLTEIYHRLIPRLADKNLANDRKQLRKKVTVKYGKITFWITMSCILLLPGWHLMYNRFFYKTMSRIARRVKIVALRNNYVILNFEVIQIITFWTLLLFGLSYLEIYEDLQFFAARLGRVAVYTMPTLLFLTLRPSPLPKTLYLALLPLHKWVSRIVVLQSLLHTLLYLYIFTVRKTFSKAYKLDNFYGIVAMLAFIVIFITSLPKVRRLSYVTFYVNHYICTWVTVIFLQLHARPKITLLTIINCAILLYQIAYRVLHTRTTKLDVIQVSPNLSVVILPNECITTKTGLPGSHLRLISWERGRTLHNLWKWLIVPLQHPYTISTLPSDEDQKLIIRHGKFKFDITKEYLITGAFLPHLDFLTPARKHQDENSLFFKPRCKRCLIVVGGSAISFALPIMRILSYNGCVAKIIWVIRDYQDMRILNHYKNILVTNDSIDIFITGAFTEEDKEIFFRTLDELSRLKRRRENIEQDLVLNNELNFNNVESDQEKDSQRPLEVYSGEPSSKSRSYYGSMSSPLSEGSTGNTHQGFRKQNSISSINSITQDVLDEDKQENVDVELDNEASYRCESKIRRKQTVLTGTMLEDPSPFPQGFSAGLDSMFSVYDQHSYDVHATLACNPNEMKQIWALSDLGCKIGFGRPKMGLHYYEWCLASSCIGPVLDLYSGENICCQEVILEEEDVRRIPPDSYRSGVSVNGAALRYRTSDGEFLGTGAKDEQYLHYLYEKTRNNRKKQRGFQMEDDVWVVGAGPTGLVNNVRLWANDCGFHFHAECFNV